MVRFPIISQNISTDFTKLYLLDITTLNKVEQYLVSPDFVSAIAQFFTSPNECVQSLRIYPFDIPSTLRVPVDASSLKLGGVPIKYNNQTITCGNVLINGGNINALKKRVGEITIPTTLMKNNFLDFSNKYQLYLPYLETITLDPDQVTPKDHDIKIYVDYVINLITGELTAYVYKYNDNRDVEMLNIVNGEIGMSIPLNMSNASDIIRNTMMSMTRIATSPSASATAVVDMIDKTQLHFNSIGGFSSGLSKMFAIQDVYLMVEKPIWNKPSNYVKLYGTPIHNKMQLNELNGYATIDNIYLDDVGNITNEEKKELETLLKTGVYF